jgi:hypothetical protein
MTLGLLAIFVLYDWNTDHKFNHIFEFFSNEMQTLLGLPLVIRL